MTCDEFKKDWPVVSNRIRRRWPQLPKEEIDRIDGHTDRLYRAALRTCGVSRNEAAEQLCQFLSPTVDGTPIGEG